MIAARPLRPVHKAPLDTVRALSAIVVCVSHLIQIFWLPVAGLGTVLHLTNSVISECAVIVFFILSGYLISLSIQSNIDRNRRFFLFPYAVSRLLRIYPPLFCAVVISLLVYVILRETSLPGVNSPMKLDTDLYAARDILTLTSEEWFTALTMRSGLLVINGALWSLYIEIKLYVAAGAVALLLAGSQAWLFRAVIAGLLLYALNLAGLASDPVFVLYGAWWCLGALFFFQQKLLLRAAMFAVPSAVLLVLIVYFSNRSIYLETPRFVVLWLLSFFMFFRWKFGNSALANVASYSYTLYLVHFPLLLLAYAVFLKFAEHNQLSLWRSIASALGLVSVFAVARAVGSLAEDPVRIRERIGSFMGSRGWSR